MPLRGRSVPCFRRSVWKLHRDTRRKRESAAWIRWSTRTVVTRFAELCSQVSCLQLLLKRHFSHPFFFFFLNRSYRSVFKQVSIRSILPSSNLVPEMSKLKRIFKIELDRYAIRRYAIAY